MEVVTWKEKIKKAVGNNVHTKVQLYTEDSTSVYHYTGEGEESCPGYQKDQSGPPHEM